MLQLIPTYHHEPHFIARPTSKKIKCSSIRLIPHPKQICALPLLLRCCVVFKHLASEEQLKSSYFLCVFLLFFPSPVFLLAHLSFCFLSVLQNVHFQKTETRAEKYCVTYILFNYVKRCITKSASKHLTNYTTRLQYIFFIFFLFLLCANT